MKKILSLIKACMTNDMSLFKIKTKKNSKFNILLPLFIAFYLMFMIWGSANSLFEKIVPLNLQYTLLSLFIFGISFTTFIEGIYKSGSLMFNCKDDQLLLSLPINKRTVLFVRVFKFYIFELVFNSMFLIPIMISYIRWDPNITWTYFLTCFCMLFLLPIIPIVISCFVGMITSSISSKFKYKNIIQIFISLFFMFSILYLSFNSNKVFNFMVNNATNMNNLITKIYYPAFIFAKLVMNFNILDLIIFILINIGILVLSIYILSRFYFKINSRLKTIKTSNNKSSNIDNLVIKTNSSTMALIKKELNTFFNIPVFIINAFFALVLFIIITIVISVKFDSIIPLLINELGITNEIIVNNLSIFIFILILITAYMTSITNSVISLEGNNITILKTFPIKVQRILISKVLAALLITTPVLLSGNIVLLIKFKISIIESLLIIILSILIPLVSHFIGIIINLQYPKLDFENTTEVIKQSTSSFISVMIGMVLLIISVIITTSLIGNINSVLLLFIATLIYLVIDIVLYIYLISKGVEKFNKLII